MNRLLAAIVLALVGCRSAIPVRRPENARPVYVGERKCDVQHFDLGAELPSGSSNLGWVSVPKQGSDDETLDLLHAKICELGGDAHSQLAWVQEMGQETMELKANAWVMP